ncbi:MAG: hypothetical protein FWD16_03980 [Clostridia bacterium]|nr:hypothetical protein [Clostridia bacterium]
MSDQKKAKQKIEEAILELLEGDNQKNALDLIAHLRTIKISLSQAYPDTWRANYKGKAACTIIVQNKGVHISLRGDYTNGYEKIFVNDKMKRCALNNIWIKPCRGCNKKCSDGISASILGVEHEKVCKHILNTTYFFIPDADAVECAILIVKKRCDDIDAG